ncbi:MAG: hypothetical protein ACFFEK_14185 [Candidatus Thorarchaeota archaeon]
MRDWSSCRRYSTGVAFLEREAHIWASGEAKLMGEAQERTGLEKIATAIFMIQAVLLIIVAVPLRLIPEFYFVLRDIMWYQPHVAMWAIVSVFLIRKQPKSEHTRIFVILLFVNDIIGVITSFNFDFFFWVISPARVIHSLLFVIPGIAALFYIPTMDIEKEDITQFHHETFIEEILQHDTLEEGLDYALDYIADPKYEFDPEYKQQFLEYVAERDDELGELVRARMDEERGL